MFTYLIDPCCDCFVLETPLTVAVNGDNRKELILALVNGGAHLDYRSGDGLTPLHKAAVAGKAGSIKVQGQQSQSVLVTVLYTGIEIFFGTE